MRLIFFFPFCLYYDINQPQEADGDEEYLLLCSGCSKCLVTVVYDQVFIYIYMNRYRMESMEIFFLFSFFFLGGGGVKVSADSLNLELLEVLNGDGDVHCAAVDENSRAIYKDPKKEGKEDWQSPLR